VGYIRTAKTDDGSWISFVETDAYGVRNNLHETEPFTDRREAYKAAAVWLTENTAKNRAHMKKCAVCKKPIPKSRGIRAKTCSAKCSESLKESSPVAPLKIERETVTPYQKSIIDMGWNQVQAARFLGIDPRTSRRYASGELKTPAATMVILESLLRLKPVR
jgi:hypothetical protein